jgi:hypothetical protein
MELQPTFHTFLTWRTLDEIQGKIAMYSAIRFPETDWYLKQTHINVTGIRKIAKHAMVSPEYKPGAAITTDS